MVVESAESWLCFVGSHQSTVSPEIEMIQ
eukprot:COSAG06_NODE_22101_length_734_cov_0.733858_3_plen_28_part_01